VLTALDTLLGRAFIRPEVKGKYVRVATIESPIVRHPPRVKRFSFKDAVGSKERALFALKSRLDTISLSGPLEDMKLTLTGLTGESGIQSSLFSDVRKREQLREMMRQLEALMGRRPPIFQMKDVEPWSRILERRRALTPFDP
jgi:DNA polymerase-4/protein ImuB